MKLNITKSLAKKHTPEETQAALMAFDALFAAQSKIEILHNYFQEEMQRIGAGHRFPDEATCNRLGFESRAKEARLAMCIDGFIMYLESQTATWNKKDTLELFSQMMTKLAEFRKKARRYDALRDEIASLYTDETKGDLGNIGEVAAIEFGFL